MSLLKTYCLGLLPFIMIGLITNLDTTTFSLTYSFSWWNIYLIISFLILWPLTEHNRRRLKTSSSFNQRLTHNLTHANTTPERLGSSYVNNQTFGVSRIGDANNDHPSWLARMAYAEFVTTFTLLLSPIFLVATLVQLHRG